MRILISGASGFIGTTILPFFVQSGHEITMLVPPHRKRTKTPGAVSVCEGDPLDPQTWPELIEKNHVIINLIGSSIFRRWNQMVKEDIYASRILTTAHIVNAFKTCATTKKHFFSASGIGYYGHRTNEILNEDCEPGSSFLARVAVDWEAEALKAQSYGARVVLCRFGMVMGREGGALKNMLPLFKYWCGGRWGSGTQWFSWIDGRDCARAFLFLLEHNAITGAVNFTAPNPVTNQDMAYLLRQVLRKRTLLPAIPSFLMQCILGECADVFLKGQRVIPGKLLSGGFQFRYPVMKECLSDLLAPT